jgi:hypothetical protein
MGKKEASMTMPIKIGSIKAIQKQNNIKNWLEN